MTWRDEIQTWDEETRFDHKERACILYEGGFIVSWEQAEFQAYEQIKRRIQARVQGDAK